MKAQKREGGGHILHLHDLAKPGLHFTEPPGAQSEGSKSAKLLADTRASHSVPTVILRGLMSPWMDVQGATGQTALFPWMTSSTVNSGQGMGTPPFLVVSE